MIKMLYPQRPITPLTLPKTPKEYWLQWKYDGWCLVLPGDGTAWTRRGTEITDWICFDGLNLHFDYPLHAEIFIENGRSSDVPKLKHRLLKPWIAVHDAMVEHMPFEERQLLLRRIVPVWADSVNWTVAPSWSVNTWEEVNQYFRCAGELGHEGLVLKRKESFYNIGRAISVECADWLKIKAEVT